MKNLVDTKLLGQKAFVMKNFYNFHDEHNVFIISIKNNLNKFTRALYDRNCYVCVNKYNIFYVSFFTI